MCGGSDLLSRARRARAARPSHRIVVLLYILYAYQAITRILRNVKHQKGRGRESVFFSSNDGKSRKLVFIACQFALGAHSVPKVLKASNSQKMGKFGRLENNPIALPLAQMAVGRSIDQTKNLSCRLGFFILLFIEPSIVYCRTGDMKHRFSGLFPHQATVSL